MRPERGAGAPVAITADEARARGLAAITVRLDTAAAGLIVRPFPMSGALLALNGPPGGPLAVIIWDCSDAWDASLGDAIKTKFVDRSLAPVELGIQETAQFLESLRAIGPELRPVHRSIAGNRRNDAAT